MHERNTQNRYHVRLLGENWMYLHTAHQVTKKEVENLNESAFFSKDKEFVSLHTGLFLQRK